MAKASEKQVGGVHYNEMPIQPAEYCQRNRLPWCESCVVKYVTRHRLKNGREDILKAIHYLEMLLEWEYPEEAALKAEIFQPNATLKILPLGSQAQIAKIYEPETKAAE